jgi:signal transduction histidine kinase
VLTLLASAALASRTTLPLSVLLFGLGQVFITIGFVVYSYDAVGSPPLEVRWPQVAWLGAVVVSILTAAVVALGVDRPIPLTRSAALRSHPVDARAVLYSVFGALAVSVGVAVYGQAAGEEAVLWVGLAASAWIGAAAALRTSGALASLERANERLLDLDRLKDDLLSSVSHDLRTPLVSISGFVELLLDEGAGLTPEERRRFLSAVDRNSVRMLHLVDDLLLAARLRAGNLELERVVTDVAAEARSCVDGLAPLARTGRIELRAEAAEAVLAVVDRARIGQALDNLVSNAVKFTPPGGNVEVRVRAEDDIVVVEVADSGLGIAEDERAQVFDAFFRSASAAVQATNGIGLGLHLVRAIVAAHGGSIDVETEAGVGTTFRVRLPARATGGSGSRSRARSRSAKPA